MINVVQEIVDKLRTVYPSAQYDIYTERIEQGFSAPCFYSSCPCWTGLPRPRSSR